MPTPNDPEAAKTIMDSVMPRLWKRTPNEDPFLALEVIYGPYKGAVFAFTKFDLLPHKLENGMVATKFETSIFIRPEGFREDEAWDDFCSELVLAWLSYISSHDLRPLIVAPTDGKVH